MRLQHGWCKMYSGQGAYFITATGTDIGKTFVSSLIMRYARLQGRDAVAFKPVMSGVQDYRDNDAATLLRAMGKEVTPDSVQSVSKWQFAAPLSPHRASALEGQEILLSDVTEQCHVWLTKYSHSLRLIEGVGGVSVPLNTTHTVIDWMVGLKLPVILVAGDYLGTLSHTLTALACLKVAGINVCAVIVNQSKESIEHQQTIKTLRLFSPYHAPVLSLLRCQESNDALKDESYISHNQDFFSFIDSL